MSKVDERMIAVVSSALRPLDEHSKMEAIVSLAWHNQDFSLDEFIVLIVRTFPSGEIKFFRNLKEYLRKLEITEIRCKFLRLVAGVGSILRSSEESLRREIDSSEADSLMYFAQILAETQYRGLAHQMLRLLGRLADDKFISLIFQNNPDLSKEIKDSIYEGVIIKRGGAYHMLTELEHRDHQGTANKSVSRTEIEMIQSEFEYAVQADDEDEKRVKFAKLRELMGVPEAEDWLREYYPQCAGWSFDY